MKIIFKFLFFLISIASFSKSFLFIASSDNISSGQAYIDHPDLNNKSSARPMVTQLYNNVYNNHEVAVKPVINGSEVKWYLYNTDGSNLPVNSTYIIHVPDNSDLKFFVGNLGTATTFLNLGSNELDKFLNSPIFVSQIGGNNTSAVAISSNSTTFRIFATGTSSIPPSTNYAVFMHRGINSFIHKSFKSNSSFNVTYIDHPALNGNPEAYLTVSYRSTGLNKPIGVWYDNTEGKWSIFTQDRSVFPTGILLNVYFENGKDFEEYTAFSHISSTQNINFFVSELNHSSLNNKPNVKPIVNQVVNSIRFPGSNLTSKPIGIYYQASTNKWNLYTIDKSNFPSNVAFNILVPNSEGFKDSVTSAKRFGVFYNFSDSIKLVNNPHAALLYTQNWKSSEYDTSLTGLTYFTEAWGLTNKAQTNIKDRTNFHFLQVYGRNTLVLDAGTGIYIDHPKANGNSNAALFVAPVYNVLGRRQSQLQSSKFTFFPVYDNITQKWWVNFQDNPANLGINVFIGDYALVSSSEDKMLEKASFLYPNPTQKSVMVSSEVESIQIFSIEGSLLRNIETIENKLDISFLKAGVYNVKLKTPSNTTVEKLVVVD